MVNAVVSDQWQVDSKGTGKWECGKDGRQEDGENGNIGG